MNLPTTINSSLHWEWIPYDGLSAKDLHDVLIIRQAVFIVEQRCIYADADEYDQYAIHLLAKDERGAIVAYARLLPPGVKSSDVIIGRVLVSKKYRGNGLGAKLIESCIERCATMYSESVIRLSAQIHLIEFYQTFNFCQIGSIYDDAGIAHIDMIRR